MNIDINIHSSIRLSLDKIIYFDPFKIEEDKHDADIIFITHDHYDHFDVESINMIKNDNTIVVAPATIKESVNQIDFKEYIYLNPFDDTTIDNINIKAVPAYNINKKFHPQSNNWLGYIITYNNTSYYIAGDTDATREAKQVKCDVALVPIGGTYTMNVEEAVELIKTINPSVAIPTHYGAIVGNLEDGKRFKELLSDTNIEVIEKV
jgi:L-ascorbate metabolism protein UlaG (beta-lactamase superfamily)